MDSNTHKKSIHNQIHSMVIKDYVIKLKYYLAVSSNKTVLKFK
jgi:hypothetical protein